MRRVDQIFEGGGGSRRITVRPGEREDAADVAFDGGESAPIVVERDAAGRLVLRLADGSVVRGAAVRDGKRLWVSYGGRSWCFEAASGPARERGATGGLGPVRAPMTGKVVEVSVRAGDVVEAGAPLLTLEAMKMEHRLTAPSRAKVASVAAVAGRQAADGDVLLVLEAAP